MDDRAILDLIVSGDERGLIELERQHYDNCFSVALEILRGQKEPGPGSVERDPGSEEPGPGSEEALRAAGRQCVFDIFMKLWNGRETMNPADLAPRLEDFLESQVREQARSKNVDRLDGSAVSGVGENGLFIGVGQLIDGNAILLDGEKDPDADGGDPDGDSRRDTEDNEEDGSGEVDGQDGSGSGKKGILKNKKKLILIASLAMVVLITAGAILTAFSLKKRGSGEKLPPDQSPYGNAAKDPEEEYSAVHNEISAWLGHSVTSYSVESAEVKFPDVIDARLLRSSLGTGTVINWNSELPDAFNSGVDTRLTDLVSTLASYYDKAIYDPFGGEIQLGANGHYYYESEVKINDINEDYPSFPYTGVLFSYRIKVGYMGTYEWKDYGYESYGTGRLLYLTAVSTVFIPFRTEEDFYSLNPQYSPDTTLWIVDGFGKMYRTPLDINICELNADIEKRLMIITDYTGTPSYYIALQNSIQTAELARTGFRTLRTETVTDSRGNSNTYLYRQEPWEASSPENGGGLSGVVLGLDLENQSVWSRWNGVSSAALCAAITINEDGTVGNVAYSNKNTTDVDKISYSHFIELTAEQLKPREPDALPVDVLLISLTDRSSYDSIKTVYGIDDSWRILIEEDYIDGVLRDREIVVPGIVPSEPSLSEYIKFLRTAEIHIQQEGYLYDSDKEHPIIRKIWAYNENTGYGSCTLYDASGNPVAMALALLTDSGEWQYTSLDGNVPVYHDVDWLREYGGRYNSPASAGVLPEICYGYFNLKVTRRPDFMVVYMNDGNIDGSGAPLYQLYTRETVSLPLPGETSIISSTIPSITFSVQVRYTGHLDSDNGVATMTYESSEYVGLSGITYEALFDVYSTKLAKMAYSDWNYYIDSMSLSTFCQELDKYLSSLINNAERQDEPFEWLKVDLSAETLVIEAI